MHPLNTLNSGPRNCNTPAANGAQSTIRNQKPQTLDRKATKPSPSALRVSWAQNTSLFERAFCSHCIGGFHRLVTVTAGPYTSGSAWPASPVADRDIRLKPDSIRFSRSSSGTVRALTSPFLPAQGMFHSAKVITKEGVDKGPLLHISRDVHLTVTVVPR